MEKLFSWIEIPASDFSRAVKFYSSLLGAELKSTGSGSEKMAFFPSGQGAVSYAPGFAPSPNGVLVSLDAQDKLDETIKLIAGIGGQIVQQKTKIEAENCGYFALFIDSEGNKLSLHGNN
jgi:uncharacterized protein